MMRRYESQWQRFAQPDPYDGSYDLTDPQTLNRYAYVQNDPVNLVDPSGLEDGIDIGEAGVVTIMAERDIISDSPDFYFESWGRFLDAMMPNRGESSGGSRQNTGQTIRDLRNAIYGNSALLAKINSCLKQLLGNKFSKFGNQTLANAPKIDARLSSKQIAAKYAGGASSYALGVGHVGGRYGTIFIGNEWFSNPTDWTVNGRGKQPGRTPIENAYVHELGNLASYIASGGTTYTLFGVKGASDPDSGFQLQLCVYGN